MSALMSSEPVNVLADRAGTRSEYSVVESTTNPSLSSHSKRSEVRDQIDKEQDTANPKTNKWAHPNLYVNKWEVPTIIIQ